MSFVVRTALQPRDGVCPFKPARNIVFPVVLVGMPRPVSDAELEVLTRIYFGAPLHLSHLSTNSFEVAERYDTYHGPGWLYSRGDLDGYDHSRAFWNTVVGPITCGGVAGNSYGQFRVVGHRHKQRLQRWIRNRRSNDVDLVRAPFVRLAERYGLGESSEIRGIAALAGGREDGASGRPPAARVERVLTLMVKFEAPEHTKGPLAGWSVTGRWVSVKRDPQWRGSVGYETYEFAHHYEPSRPDQPMDAAIALERALWEWRNYREPDSVTVDAVYQSRLSPPAGSQEDPFLGVEGTGHDGYDPSGRSKQRGRVSDA